MPTAQATTRDPRIADPKIVAHWKQIQSLLKAQNGGKPPSA